MELEGIARCWYFGFAVLVGVINVALNSWVKRASDSCPTYRTALLSWEFGVAFLIGVCSILSLLAAYKQGKLNLGSGILVMGATSIIGGTLWGVLVHGNRLRPEEWGILSCLVVFYLYRAFGYRGGI
jgi:hypothetical protein